MQPLKGAGVHTNFHQGNFLFRLFGGRGQNPNYSPVNWHKFAKEGLYENLFEGNQWVPNDNIPTSPLKIGANQYSSFSEETVYG